MTRVALVTGASRGIGRAVALGLASDGTDLIGLHYRDNTAAASQTAKELEAIGATVIPLRADLGTDTVPTATALAGAFLDAVEEHTGARRFDVLVNNVGGARPRPFNTVDEAAYRVDLDLNLTAPLFLLRALAPYIAPGGRVVNVSTGFTRTAAPEHLVYGAAKSGLNYLTLCLAPELAERGVTINAVIPGVIDTDRNAHWLAVPAQRAAANALSVFNRVGTADEVAALVRYLASPAAAWTTGQCVDVSGGSKL